MKKMVIAFLLAVVVIGCGPKMAKQETLDALAEAKAALEAATAKVTELEDEADALNTQKAELEQAIDNLSAEISTLQNKIDARCKK